MEQKMCPVDVISMCSADGQIKPQIAPPGNIAGRQDQAFIHRQDALAVAQDPPLFAQRLLKGLAQAEAVGDDVVQAAQDGKDREDDKEDA